MVSEGTAVGRFSRANEENKGVARERGDDRREDREREERRWARERRGRVKWILCISEAATRFWISIIAPCAIDEERRD